MMNALYAPLVVGADAAAILLFGAMFVTRVLAPRWSRPFGFAGTGMALPLAAASLAALAAGADVWLGMLPAVFVVVALVEAQVDVLADGRGAYDAVAGPLAGGVLPRPMGRDRCGLPHKLQRRGERARDLLRLSGLHRLVLPRGRSRNPRGSSRQRVPS
jgi:hypothetical protein